MDNLKKLAARAAAAHESAQATGIFFEVLVKHMRKAQGEAAAAEVQGSPHMPKRMMSLLRYPAANLLGLMGLCGRLQTQTGQNEQQALDGIGKAFVETYFDAPMGKVLIALGGQNPNRLLSVVPAAYLGAFTFGKRRYERKSDRDGVMHFEGDLLGSTVTRGIFELGIKLAVGVEAQSVVATESEDCATFSLQLNW